ncbi:MAG: hypothetical protein GY714_03990 [Desulfobacterales bacterium]|nr:hypothetical protein [Desulfobacterales bacterium]MCP4160624.1 hypothetical protein [Deltaproteobacteria bacterium]
MNSLKKDENSGETEKLYKELFHKTSILIGFFYDTKYKLEKLSLEAIDKNVKVGTKTPGELIKRQFLYWRDYCNFLTNLMTPFQFMDSDKKTGNDLNENLLSFIDEALDKTYETIKLTIDDVWKITDLSNDFSIKSLENLNESFSVPWEDIDNSEHAIEIINKHGNEMIKHLKELVNALDSETRKELKSIDAYMISKLFPGNLFS